MRLTAQIRQAFIRAVMADTPQTDYKSQIRELALKAVIETLPQEIQDIWNNPKLRGYLCQDWNYYGKTSVTHPCRQSGSAADISEEAQKQIDHLESLHEAQDAWRKDLEAQLHTIVFGVKTRADLVKVLPEFEKYLPEVQQPSQQLPVVANVVSQFVKAGWPAGKQANADAVAKSPEEASNELFNQAA